MLSNGPLWRNMSVSNAFLHMSLGFPYKQGLQIKQNLTSLLNFPVKQPPHPWSPNGIRIDRDVHFHSLPLHILQGLNKGALPLGSTCGAPVDRERERERETLIFQSPPPAVSQSLR